NGVRKLLDAVAGEDGEAAASLARNLEFDYAKPRQKPDCDWRSKPARERLLTRVARDAERALRAVESEPGLAAGPVVEAARLRLRRPAGASADRFPARGVASAAPARRFCLRRLRDARATRRASGRGARPGARASGSGRADRQTRLPDRSRRRRRHLPCRPDRSHRAAAALGHARRRLPRSRLPRLPAQAALRAWPPRTQDRPPPARGL